MAADKAIRLSKLARELNVGTQTIVDFLHHNGFYISANPNTKIPIKTVNLLKEEYKMDKTLKKYSDKIVLAPTNVYEDKLDSTNTYGNEPIGTSTYENKAVGNTGAYEGKPNHTGTYEDNTPKSKTQKHNLGIGDIIELKEKYEITDIISEGTKEAVIYKIKDNSDNIYALKLYFEFDNEKRNLEPNAETLTRIKDITDPGILKLIDFGVGEFEKYQNKYCFEISVYAKGGDLLNVNGFKAKYTPQFIEDVIIPEIFMGIKTLHCDKIYHCDLKPSNIFYLDKEQTDIVIGDYGNAKTEELSENSDEQGHISTIIFATQYYAAPELKGGNHISTSVDYFSFGMILLHLLYPEEFCVNNNPQQIDKKKFRAISSKLIYSEKLIDYNKTYSRINKLIEGLTLNIVQNRWGEQEVEKWLAGKDDELEVKYLSSGESKAIINVSGNKIIETKDDLIEFLNKTENWYEELFEDETTNRELNNWLNIKYKKDKRVEINSIIKFYQTNVNAPISSNIRKNENIDYTKQAFIRYLRPNFPIDIEEELFHFKIENTIDKKFDEALRSYLKGDESVNDKETDFLSSIVINGKERIPSDTFKIGKNEFMLMDISVNPKTKKITLKIMGSEGEHLSDLVFLSPEDFERVLIDGNFNERLYRIIYSIEKKWHILSIEKIRYILFQLEYSLKRLCLEVDSNSKTVLDAILTKLYAGLSSEKTDFSDFKSEVTRCVKVNEENKTLSRIINLFNAFNTNRTFKYKNTKYSNLQELGLFFVNNEDLYTSPKVRAEKNWFLQKTEHSELADLPYRDFIFEVFKDNAAANIEYNSLTFDKHRDYTVKYKYYKSLTDFLSTNNIQKEFTSLSEETETFQCKRNFLQKFKSVANLFIANVKQKHNISRLAKTNERDIRKQFVSDSWKQYYKIYRGQFLAFLILVYIFSFISIIVTSELKEKREFDEMIYQSKLKNHTNDLTKKLTSKEKKANSYVNKFVFKYIRIYSGTIDKYNRQISSPFTSYKNQYIWFDLRFSSKKRAKDRKNYKFNYTIYKDDEKFAEFSKETIQEQESWSGWSSEKYYIYGWGSQNNNYWKKGNYKVVIHANNRYLGSKDFTIKGATAKSINNRNESSTNSTSEIDKSVFIGNWKIDNGNSKYTFYSNGNGNYINSRGRNFSFKWSVNNNYLKIILNSDNSEWNWKIKSFTSNRIAMYSSQQNINRIITK